MERPEIVTGVKSNSPSLLKLPLEIRSQIWYHVARDIDIPVFTKTRESFQFEDFVECEPCSVQHPHRARLERFHDTADWIDENRATTGQSDIRDNGLATPGRNMPFDLETGFPAYVSAVANLLVCRTIFTEALPILQKTARVHIASPEAMGAMKRFAPLSFSNTVQNVVLYVHLSGESQMSWMRALDRLPTNFPGLKRVKVHYHMRPPISYEFLMDALYLTIPILSWPAPLDKPRFVLAEETQAAHDSRSSFAKSEGTTVLSPGTSQVDEKEGVTIHCCYKTAEVLFEARFLGSISTCDSIEEHTAVIRALFHDETYIAAARNFVTICHGHGSESGRWVSAGVPGVHLPAFQIGSPSPSSSTPDATIPTSDAPPRQVPGELQDPASSVHTGLFGVEGANPVVNHVQRCLLEVARRYERPWFEKLQRRRVVELYMQQGGMSQAEAEMLVDRQTAELGEAGVQGVVEGILGNHPDLDE